MDDKVEELSGERALSVLVEAKLTRHQYEIIRSEDKRRFLSYKKIQDAKKYFYPDSKAIIIIEMNAKSLTEKELQCLTLVFKWGCDESSRFTQYKQKFKSSDDSDARWHF
ncbi:unnamed protein product [Psylliodes chrysocephalus]|uniref:Uncharacterized protein n=1 Tax=Psylliodes chrysocephalus TaxID=3402493 RepID=A0A9P0D7J2_9CUCU|nr:unnamed protein product [Psylliodes chrysocephala]